MTPIRLIPCWFKHTWTPWVQEGWHYYTHTRGTDTQWDSTRSEHLESRECTRCSKVELRFVED